MGKAYVVDTTRSLYSLLKPVAVNDVSLSDEFWSPRIKTTIEVTLPKLYELLEQNDRINRFRWASGKIPRRPERSLYPFDDSDLYKWIEACAYALSYAKENAKIRELVNDVVPEIIAAQEDDGYLFTEYHGKKYLRWTDLTFAHELYCAGHLIQAAIALRRATGDERLFNAARRFADLIVDTFNPESLKGVSGHPEIEMALIELYRETRDKKYLETASFFLEERGKNLLKPRKKELLMLYNLLGGAEYFIDHKPIRKLSEMTGHAVRSLYLNCGITDLYLETGDKSLYDIMERLWDNMVHKKMYVTGGVGARYISESFGDDYELPNERSYAETCAAIANVMWNWRMLLATGDARFADIMELALYNAVLAGISLDGRKYFYTNPLADSGKSRRQEWFPVACCPTNIVRILTSVQGYFYSISEDGIWVHLYASGRAELNYKGKIINIVQETDYPWDGRINIKVEPVNHSEEFSVYLRIPGWSDIASIYLGDKRIEAKPGTYVEIRKTWEAGDMIRMILQMPIKLITSHPHVTNNFAKVALKRGPIVYCLEQVDNPGAHVWNILLDSEDELSAQVEQLPVLGEIVVINGNGLVLDGERWKDSLYLPLEKTRSKKLKRIRIKAIPYYAWANRSPGAMTVWIPVRDYPFLTD